MQEIVHCYPSHNTSSRVIPFLPRVEEVVAVSRFWKRETAIYLLRI